MPATNLYFNNYANLGEQTLIEDLIIESIKIYGIECYYMPRTLVAEDNIFGEDPLSKFEQAYNIEMYIKSVDGFEGEGDFLSRFNIEIRDEITFVVARRRWSEEIGEDQSTPVDGDGVARPAEGRESGPRGHVRNGGGTPGRQTLLGFRIEEVNMSSDKIKKRGRGIKF